MRSKSLISHPFLTAEWRKLAMVNYAIDPALLLPFLPAKTELDTWNGTCYVSLVGFLFTNTRLLGLRIPFHTQFEEVNLRFYVRQHENGAWKRGVVFIKEIVPKRALSLVANTWYGEKYQTLPMKHHWLSDGDLLSVEYAWKKANWHRIHLTAQNKAEAVLPGSEAEFITEHYWGYTLRGPGKTSIYQVEHPRWEMYPVLNYFVDVDFGALYGSTFSHLQLATPVSVFLAEGSAIAVKNKQIL